MMTAGEALAACGRQADEDIDICDAALWLASINHPGIRLERYRHHLEKLTADVGARHAALLAAGAKDDAPTQLAALKHVIADTHGYQADHEAPGHIQNADMIRLIDRGKGSPVALSILYIGTALACGWAAFGLDIPGCFAVRMDKDGQRLIFDPAEGCAMMQAADMRRTVKQALGPQAELSAGYYEPVSNRAMLVRLQNHIRFRQIEHEDYEGALQSVEALRALAPAEYRLLLDAGVLYARTGRAMQAIAVLEDYIGRAPEGRDRHEAVYLLRQIKETI